MGFQVASGLCSLLVEDPRQGEAGGDGRAHLIGLLDQCTASLRHHCGSEGKHAESAVPPLPLHTCSCLVQSALSCLQRPPDLPGLPSPPWDQAEAQRAVRALLEVALDMLSLGGEAVQRASLKAILPPVMAAASSLLGGASLLL